LKLLLDTHALLWFLTDDGSLSASAKASIETLGNSVFVSPASYWEIAIKISLGKYRLPEPLSVFMRRELANNEFSILPIAIDHAARVAELPFHHRDPFDRLIVAQALVEEMPIISVDLALDAYGVTRIW
jgi:PIN domain nuclease of toxin-antitoxin system